MLPSGTLSLGGIFFFFNFLENDYPALVIETGLFSRGGHCGCNQSFLPPPLYLGEEQHLTQKQKPSLRASIPGCSLRAPQRVHGRISHLGSEGGPSASTRQAWVSGRARRNREVGAVASPYQPGLFGLQVTETPISDGHRLTNLKKSPRTQLPVRLDRAIHSSRQGPAPGCSGDRMTTAAPGPPCS